MPDYTPDFRKVAKWARMHSYITEILRGDPEYQRALREGDEEMARERFREALTQLEQKHEQAYQQQLERHQEGDVQTPEEFGDERRFSSALSATTGGVLGGAAGWTGKKLLGWGPLRKYRKSPVGLAAAGLGALGGGAGTYYSLTQRGPQPIKHPDKGLDDDYIQDYRWWRSQIDENPKDSGMVRPYVTGYLEPGLDGPMILEDAMEPETRDAVYERYADKEGAVEEDLGGFTPGEEAAIDRNRAHTLLGGGIGTGLGMLAGEGANLLLKNRIRKGKADLPDDAVETAVNKTMNRISGGGALLGMLGGAQAVPRMTGTKRKAEEAEMSRKLRQAEQEGARTPAAAAPSKKSPSLPTPSDYHMTPQRVRQLILKDYSDLAANAGDRSFEGVTRETPVRRIMGPREELHHLGDLDPVHTFSQGYLPMGEYSTSDGGVVGGVVEGEHRPGVRDALGRAYDEVLRQGGTVGDVQDATIRVLREHGFINESDAMPKTAYDRPEPRDAALTAGAMGALSLGGGYGADRLVTRAVSHADEAAREQRRQIKNLVRETTSYNRPRGLSPKLNALSQAAAKMEARAAKLRTARPALIAGGAALGAIPLVYKMLQDPEFREKATAHHDLFRQLGESGARTAMRLAETGDLFPKEGAIPGTQKYDETSGGPHPQMGSYPGKVLSNYMVGLGAGAGAGYYGGARAAGAISPQNIGRTGGRMLYGAKNLGLIDSTTDTIRRLNEAKKRLFPWLPEEGLFNTGREYARRFPAIRRGMQVGGAFLGGALGAGLLARRAHKKYVENLSEQRDWENRQKAYKALQDLAGAQKEGADEEAEARSYLPEATAGSALLGGAGYGARQGNRWAADRLERMLSRGWSSIDASPAQQRKVQELMSQVNAGRGFYGRGALRGMALAVPPALALWGAGRWLQEDPQNKEGASKNQANVPTLSMSGMRALPSGITRTVRQSTSKLTGLNFAPPSLPKLKTPRFTPVYSGLTPAKTPFSPSTSS